MMSLFPSARSTRRVLGGLAAAATILALAACGTPSGDTAADTRTYESDFGAVEIPQDIERVVSIDFYTPAALQDIGITPVGVVNSYFTDTEGDAIPLEYSEAIREAGADSIGEYYELNLEAIVQAKPDLVLATQDFLPLDDPMRPEIEKIAPIITFNARDGEAWRTRSVELAKIFDKEAELQPLVDEYTERRDEIATKYADILANNTFTLLGPDPDEWGTYGSKHFMTPILRDLGAKFREQQDDEVTKDGFPEWFSYEELGRLSNADIILLRDSPQENIDALAKNTLWNNLPAVQNGMVFDYIDRGPTGSFGWALQNLDDLEERFAEIQSKVDAAQ
ncbi:ABC transporter substrate-binding protein [Leucobacter sp. 7(1)]|uniref:ABC transporter substrate-binding protein n=1 Tax=Leucobacter sp. 7(1) TaxID=1255613 RepID=UPI000B350368|nr:ABC transporter substrate-binding protein [Leucobacter sp. 7(1)]